MELSEIEFEKKAVDDIKKCVFRLDKLNGNIKDISEFHNFIDSIERFLGNESDHEIYKQPVLKALKSKKKQVISVSLYIASFLKVEAGFVPRRIVKKALMSRKTRDSALAYMRKFKIDFLDSKISNMLLKDSTFVSKELYKYIEEKKHIALRFLSLKEHRHAYRQLELVINSRVFFNMPYFIHYLGDSSKLICYKAFEAFQVFFEAVEVENVKDSHQGLLEIERFTHQDGKSIYFDPNNKIFPILTEDPKNFIRFGWQFLEEKEVILDLIQNKNKRLSKVINKYCKGELDGEELEIAESELVAVKRDKKDNNIKTTEIGSFNHLFGKNYKKDNCDCHEL